MENYILMIEKELSKTFEKLGKTTNKNWNWKNSNSHISIMCPKSHNQLF